MGQGRNFLKEDFMLRLYADGNNTGRRKIDASRREKSCSSKVGTDDVQEPALDRMRGDRSPMVIGG